MGIIAKMTIAKPSIKTSRNTGDEEDEVKKVNKGRMHVCTLPVLKKIKGTWSAPYLVCGHSQVQLLEDMHNCTSLKSVMFKKQLTLLEMSLTQPWHLFKG